MFKFLNSYFGFNKQQRNGLLVLCIVMFLLLILRLNINYFITPANITVHNLPLIEQGIDSAYASNKNYKNYHYVSNKKPAQLFAFNPNTVTEKQLVQLGFREKTAATFIKFRNRGFIFKQKEDLKKIYGVSDYLYNQLEDYIVIEKSSTKNEEKTSGGKKSNFILELNSADSLQLLELKGIGPSFAKRILKYKSMLGGYVTINQLTEVYGFTPEMFENIKNNVKVDPSKVEKLNINEADFKTINKNPYFTYELTKLIFNYKRKQNLTEESLKTLINDEALFQKLKPYLEY